MLVSNCLRGTASEYAAAAAFSNEGWTVFWTPTGSSVCDFIVVRGEMTMKVQVKSAGWYTKGKSKYLRASLSTQNRAYEQGDFDIYAIVDKIDDRIWCIPFADAPKTSLMYLEKKVNGVVSGYGWEQWMIQT